MSKEYPKMKYKKSDKTKEGYAHKIFISAEHEAKHGKDYVDSPADLGIETHPGLDQHEEQDEFEKAAAEGGPEDSSDDDEGDVPSSSEFADKSAGELRAILMDRGVSKSELKGKNKAELIAMIEG